MVQDYGPNLFAVQAYYQVASILVASVNLIA